MAPRPQWRRKGGREQRFCLGNQPPRMTRTINVSIAPRPSADVSSRASSRSAVAGLVVGALITAIDDRANNTRTSLIRTGMPVGTAGGYGPPGLTGNPVRESQSASSWYKISQLREVCSSGGGRSGPRVSECWVSVNEAGRLDPGRGPVGPVAPTRPVGVAQTSKHVG